MNINSTDFVINQLINSPTTFNYGVKTIWFDQPYNLYLEEIQSKAYLEMISGEKFASLVHEPAKQLIEEFKGSILKDIKEPIEFYDLGPGLPTKTIPLLKALQKLKRDFKYIPVDISKSFLKITENKVKKIGVQAHSLNCFFEDLPAKIKYDQKVNRIFFIGLTFDNYRPDKILSLLKKVSNPNSISIIITEFFSSKKKETILIPYRDKHAENFNYLVLKIAGIDKNKLKYFTQYKNQRIEMGFTLRRDIRVRNLTIKRNTKIITAISYRYTKQALIRTISDYFKHFEIYQSPKHDISLVTFKLFEK